MATSSPVSFHKVSGAGNDFIVLVDPPRAPRAEEIRAWCRRGISLGADGVITLARTEDGARMAHYNADGGRSGLCLNGSRCAAQLAFDLGWSEEALALATDAGTLTARRAGGGRVALELPAIAGEPRPAALEVGGTAYEGFRLEVGVPHFVLPWGGSLSRAPVAELGPLLRAHPALAPHGANVSFVAFPSAARLEIRTYERGVEAETLACGTGVVAAAVAGAAAGKLRLPVTALTSGGFELTVAGERRGGELRLVLTGETRIVARGELSPQAATAAPAAVWS